MASASGETPAKKPWSRPTLYVLTDLIDNHGSPTNKTHNPYNFPITEDETIPPTPGSKGKNYRPASA